MSNGLSVIFMHVKQVPSDPEAVPVESRYGRGGALQRWGRGHQRGPIQETSNHLPYDRTQVIQAVWTQR